MADQNSEGRQVEDDPLIDDLNLTEEELRALETEDYDLEDVPDEGLDENQAAPETVVQETAVHGAREGSAPDAVQGMGNAQGITSSEMNTRSEEQRVRDPAGQERDVLRDVPMPDAHDHEDNEHTQIGRENSRVTTASATARLTGDGPCSRAAAPGVQRGQLSPIFRSTGPVNMARAQPLWCGQRHLVSLHLKMQMHRR